MKQNQSQKIKILKIWEILQFKTDLEHPLTTQEMIDELAKCNVSCERRSLYRDIETLIANGYPIIKKRSGHDNVYCSDSHHFSISEARIIIDALQSVSFITESKTLQLQNKLANLSGSYNAEILQRTTMRFKAVKHQNEDVYKNIEVIENALKNKRQISFNYYHIDENKNKVYSHDKKLYIEEPIGAVLDDGNYYLLCYRTQKEYTNNLKIFRIDRIDGISVIERKISKRAETVLKKSEKIKMQAFKMYGGEVKEVTLQFTPDLIGVIYDKFGYGTKIRRNNEICRATVEVQVSPTFWGWMMQFPTKMKIYSPENLKRQYIELVKSAL